MPDHLDASRAAAQALASRFRLGQSLEAALELEPFLGEVLATLSPSQVQKTLDVLRRLLECQSREDWLGLADGLEYDFWESLS